MTQFYTYLERTRDTAEDAARLEARARAEVRAYLERTGQTEEALAVRSAQARRRYEPGQSVTPGGLWQRLGENRDLGHWQSVVNGSTTYRVVEAADLDGRRHVHARREEMREDGQTYVPIRARPPTGPGFARDKIAPLQTAVFAVVQEAVRWVTAAGRSGSGGLSLLFGGLLAPVPRQEFVET